MATKFYAVQTDGNSGEVLIAIQMGTLTEAIERAVEGCQDDREYGLFPSWSVYTIDSLGYYPTAHEIPLDSDVPEYRIDMIAKAAEANSLETGRWI